MGAASAVDLVTVAIMRIQMTARAVAAVIGLGLIVGCSGGTRTPNPPVPRQPLGPGWSPSAMLTQVVG